MGLRGDGGGGGIDPEEEQGSLGQSMDFLLYPKGSEILLHCFDDRNGMVKCVCLKKKKITLATAWNTTVVGRNGYGEID